MKLSWGVRDDDDDDDECTPRNTVSVRRQHTRPAVEFHPDYQTATTAYQVPTELPTDVLEVISCGIDMELRFPWWP